MNYIKKTVLLYLLLGICMASFAQNEGTTIQESPPKNKKGWFQKIKIKRVQKKLPKR